MKTFLICLHVFFLALILLPANVAAQSVTPVSSGIVYPIAELGNCASKVECRTYCSDPVHRTACTSYALKNGIISPTPSQIDTALSQMMKSLGCTSKESCKAFCAETTHYDACNNAAKKFNAKGGYQVDKTALATKIMSVLNSTGDKVCTSYESCKNYCDQKENREACTQAAKQAGVKGGIELKGPGGCTSVDSCKQYCEEHPSECKFTPKVTQKSAMSEDQLKTMCDIAVDKRPTVFSSGEQYKRLCVTPLPTRIIQRTGTPRILKPSPVISLSLAPDKENTSGTTVLPTIRPATDRPTLTPTIRIYTPAEQQYYLEKTGVTMTPSPIPTKPLLLKTPTPTIRIYTPAEQQYYQTVTGVTMTPSPTPTRTATQFPSPTLIRISPTPTIINTSQFILSLTPTRPPIPPSPTRPPTANISPTPAVQGAYTERSVWERIMDYIFVQPLQQD